MFQFSKVTIVLKDFHKLGYQTIIQSIDIPVKALTFLEATLSKFFNICIDKYLLYKNMLTLDQSLKRMQRF